MTHARHYRRLAHAALNLTCPDAQRDAMAVLARALLDCAADLAVVDDSLARAKSLVLSLSVQVVALRGARESRVVPAWLAPAVN